MPRFRPLHDDEKEALWLTCAGLTREQIAEVFSDKYGYSQRKSERTIDDAYGKINAFNQKEAVSIAIASDIVPVEKVRRHYGISSPFPATQFTEERSLRGTVSLPLLPDLSNPYEVNSWLAEEVVKKTQRPHHWDSEKLYSSFSQLLTKARNSSTIYPDHPLTLNTHAVQSIDGYCPSISIEYDRAIVTESYLQKDPRLLFMGHLPIETLPNEISTDIARPITVRGDTTADLVSEMLEYRKQISKGFSLLVEKWYCLDIIPMSAVKGLVENRTKAKDDWLQYMGANPLEPDHVEEWLRNLVGLLNWYGDNFHLALLNDIKYPNHYLAKSIRSNVWSVKVGGQGQNALLWEEWAVDAQRRRREVDRRVTEVDAINGLIGVLGYSWKYLREDILIRDKDAVIKYLVDQGSNIKPW